MKKKKKKNTPRFVTQIFRSSPTYSKGGKVLESILKTSSHSNCFPCQFMVLLLVLSTITLPGVI